MARIGGFRATPSSLEKSELVAKALGIPFDENVTGKLVDNLHDQYFQGILSIIGPIEGVTGFYHGDFRHMNAAITQTTTDQTTSVLFDQQLDFWLLDLTHLTYVAAAFALEAHVFQRLAESIDRCLDWRIAPHRLEHDREMHNEFFFSNDFTRGLMISHPLSRAMTIFIICHELAHAALGHSAISASEQLEFAADAKAAEYFQLIVAKGTEAGVVTVDPALASAPQLLMRFFESEHRKHPSLHAPNANGLRSHPEPLARRAALAKLIEPRLTERGKIVLAGMSEAIEAIDVKLGRGSS